MSGPAGNEVTGESTLGAEDVVGIKFDLRLPVLRVSQLVKWEVRRGKSFIWPADAGITGSRTEDRITCFDTGIYLVFNAYVSAGMKMAGGARIAITSRLGIPEQRFSQLLCSNPINDVVADIGEEGLNALQRAYCCREFVNWHFSHK